MEEKTIQVPGMGKVTLEDDGKIMLKHHDHAPVWLGGRGGKTARQFAHAILELCGEAPKEEPKRDNCYIAIRGEYDKWLDQKPLDAIEEYPDDPVNAFSTIHGNYPGEFHIFRRVATVGPIPQPEREVTRYE